MRPMTLPPLRRLLAAVALSCTVAAAPAARADDEPEPTRERVPEVQEESEAAFAIDVEGNLYQVDCVKARYRKLGKVRVPGEANEIPVLCDLAATPDGYLYAVSETTLYLVNLADPTKSKKIGEHGLYAPYGMGFLSGRLVVNTADGRVFTLDPETARPTEVGPMGGGFVASGDVDALGDRVYSSVKDDDGVETLVEIDLATGRARRIGAFVDETGEAVSHVFGLIEMKGSLFGLTSGGRLLRVDPKTARCKSLLRTSIPWWGASAYLRI